MAEETNDYVFCADFSAMAACLFAIQNQEAEGLYAGDQVLLDMLNQFENDLLKKLYNRTLRILGIINGVLDGGSIGLTGDFDDLDYSAMDFQTGYLDSTNDGYSSQFQTILNIFDAFCSREDEISDADKASLTAAFIPVLDAFKALQAYLSSAGLNPCQDQAISYFNNAPELHLHVAGSDGSNGWAQGIFLRWLLNGELGEKHFPQGNFANGSSSLTGFNRENDFVYISRTPYIDPLVFTLDFTSLKPAINLLQRKWTYLLNITRDGKKFSNTVSVYFIDVLSYLQQVQHIDPYTNPFNFLKSYKGLLEIEMVEKTAFSIGLTFNKSEGTVTSVVKIEALTLPDDGTTDEVPSLRNTLNITSGNTLSSEFNGENIRRIRIQKDNTIGLQSFAFETYHDFFNSRADNAWTVVNNGFGLSLDDQAVFKQLEDPGTFDINHLWPQYKDGTTLKVSNYHDKWTNSTEDEISLKTAVQDYLTLSQTDPDAGISIGDNGEGMIRYTDILNLQAVDFHVARMLGLGYVDTAPELTANPQFVYKMMYTNKSTAAGNVTSFVYLSLPIGKIDARLPEKPLIRPLSYQLADDGGQFLNGFDAQGYDTKRNVRLINIGRLPAEGEIAETDFFNGTVNNEFNLGAHCRSIIYGIEYRPASQSNYVLPGITENGTQGTPYYAYNDQYDGNLPETVPVLDNEISLYTHFEEESGVHYYAIYGIDLFSRSTALSDEVATDETVFPLDNQLTPPTDLTVQYIQQEDTLIFTTSTEQAWLQGRRAAFPEQDTAFTRFTFNWVDILDITSIKVITPAALSSMIKGNLVKTYFKQAQSIQVSGIIEAIGQINDRQFRLLAGKYALLDNTQVIPAIADQDLGKFTNSILITPDNQFRVVSVVNLSIGLDPAERLFITIEPVQTTEKVEDTDDPTAIGTMLSYTAPVKGSRFTMAENLSTAGNWDTVQASINLIDHSDKTAPITESIADSQGNITTLWIGGVNGGAEVIQASDTTGQPMPDYYKISYGPGISLAPHPQVNLPYDPGNPTANAPDALNPPHVEWYNGKVRLPLLNSADDKKMLDVIRIEQNDPLVIYAYDPTYADIPVQLSSAPGELIDQVNFHPGYRAYLFTEPAPENNFNGDNILPLPDVNDKKSLVAMQIIDQRDEGDVFSGISMPAILLALNIVEPEQPDELITYNLKVRPDATAKAAFTFDLPVRPDAKGNARNPFGWMFYRTHNQSVLNSLYLTATVTAILNALAGLTEDTFFNNRYLDLVNVKFDPANPGYFKVYDAQPNPYGFPLPDLPAIAMDPVTNQPYAPGNPKLVANYLYAIHTTLLPLTEQIPVLAYIKTGLQTENKEPSIRSVDGNLLDPSSPDFNPFPMVRRYAVDTEPNTTYIRFTDYMLKGSSRFLYFYAVVEVTNRLAQGPLSLFAGAVTILHTLPGEAPIIRSYLTGPNAGTGSSPVSVTFKISPFASYDPITKIRIYRASNPDDTQQLSTMPSYLDVDLAYDADSGIEVADDFSDLTLAPLGETVYYRFAFIRSIINELEQPEIVVSLGSDVLAVKLIDMFNPDAPQLTYDGEELSWPATANKGKYYLYQQNSKGNWQKIYEVTDNLTNEEMIYSLSIPHEDENGNPIYNRFKVKAENASGLFNLVDNELTI